MLQRPPRFGRPLLFVSPVWLLRSANGRGIRLGTRRPNWRGWRFHREEFVVIQVAVEVPRQLRRLGTKSRPSTFQENDGHNPPILRVGKGTKPPEASAILGTSARLSQHRLLDEVRA